MNRSRLYGRLAKRIGYVEQAADNRMQRNPLKQDEADTYSTAGRLRFRLIGHDDERSRALKGYRRDRNVDVQLVHGNSNTDAQPPFGRRWHNDYFGFHDTRRYLKSAGREK